MTIKKIGVRISILLSMANLSSVAAGVNPDGSYSETIPIEIPAGRAGMQPSLALTYNSNAGNGMVGVGWSLQGLPSITRVNYGRGINYDGADTYAGPEGRLIDVSGGKTLFHAENENFAKYEPQGQCGDGPCSWVVTDRNGVRYYYGQTSDSQAQRVWVEVQTQTTVNQLSRFENCTGFNINGGCENLPASRHSCQQAYVLAADWITNPNPFVPANYDRCLIPYQTLSYASSSINHIGPSIRSWALSRVEDLNGNAYAIQYQQDAGQIYPEKITYTIGNGASQNYAVLFSYDQSGRPDKEVSFAKNAEVKTNWRLERIDVSIDDTCFIFFNCNTIVRSYALVFDTSSSSNKSRLISFEEFALASSTALASRSFNYSAGGAGLVTALTWGPGGVDSSGHYRQAVGDFTGDGREDICWRGSGWGNWYCSSMSGPFGLNGGIDIQGDGHYTQAIGDFDGDGRTDIAYTRSGWGGWALSFGDGRTGGMPTGPDWVDTTGNYRQAEGDFNGDGKQDICWRRSGWGAWACTSVDGAFALEGSIDIQNDAAYAQAVADFNNDGKTDIAYTRSGWGSWVVSLGGGGAVTLATGPATDSNNLQYRQVLGDFNGDGKADVCWRIPNSSGWSCTSIIGAFALTVVSEYQYDSAFAQEVGDFDGDGRTDIAYTRSGWGKWTISLGGGGSMSMSTGPDAVDANGTYRQATGDFNGDGKADICWRRSGWGGWACTSVNGAFGLAGGIDIQGDSA